MNDYDDQDYESFLNNFDITNESENEWILSNSNSISQSMLSSDYDLNSIVTSDSLPNDLILPNETFLLSPTLSEITTNESSNFSLFEQVPSSLNTVPLDQRKSFEDSFIINSKHQFFQDLQNNFVEESKTDFHQEILPDFPIESLNDINISNSSFNGNQNLESKLSYVIIDKVSFDNLLEKSQMSQNEAICKYSYSQLISLNSTPENIIPVNNIKVNFLSHPFQSVYENSSQIVFNKSLEESNDISKVNNTPIIGTPIFIQDTRNVDGDILPLLLGNKDILASTNSQSNFASYNTYNIINNSLNIIPNESVQLGNKDFGSTNISSNLSQISSNSSQNTSEYKVETMVISDNEEFNDDQLCLVCGDTASCQHYGVKSCEGCKGFFKRTIQKNASQTYVCLHNQNCVIDKQNRNRCQFCRYVKCIKVGMVKEIVRKESLKGRRGRLSSKVKMKNNGTQSVYTVVNLLSTIKTAVEFSEPRSLEKITLKEFHSIERIQKKIKSEDIISYVTNELHESLKVVKQFAEKLIGFNTLSKRDQTLILVLNGLEFITLRAGLRLFSDYLTVTKNIFETINGSIILDNGCILSKAFLARSIFSSWSIQTQELAKQLVLLHNNDKEIVNGILAVTLLKIEIDSDEGKQLEDASLVYSLRHRYIEVLKTYCNSKMITESNVSSTNKSSKKSVCQPHKQRQNNHISDPKFLSKLLDKQMNVQSIVKNHLLKPIIKQYFNTENINDCDEIFKNLLSGQEIKSFCPKWLFKLIVYKTMPHLCLQQL